MALQDDPHDLPSQLLAHLEAAKSLATRLQSEGAPPPGGQASHAPAARPTVTFPVASASPSGQVPKELYTAAEKRANLAEAQVSRLNKEIAGLRSHVSSTQHELQRLAYQDPLTGLANAHLIEEHLQKLLQSQNLSKLLLLLLIDVDHFSTINHTLGHELGDELLVRVGERLAELTVHDTAVGRLAEDEFAVVCHLPRQSDSNQQASHLCQRIQAILNRPFLVQGQSITLTVSQGGAYSQNEEDTARELLERSRIALARAKRSGRDQICLFNPALERDVRRDATLEFHLKYAVEDNELFFEYLPIFWLDNLTGRGVSGRLIGVEALLRWRHRVEGVLGPEAFLHAAERSGAIVAIGEKMLRVACAQQSAWSRQGVDLFINFNLSGRQLLDSTLPKHAALTCQEAGVPRERITFEFDESLTSANVTEIQQTLTALRVAGFSLALDNFGAGSCSFQLLSQSQFLKLSPQLVRGTPEVCAKALAVAASLGLVAVAVGIETAETARFIIESGCPTVQGFFFSKPLDHEGVARLHASPLRWEL